MQFGAGLLVTETLFVVSFVNKDLKVECFGCSDRNRK